MLRNLLILLAILAAPLAARAEFDDPLSLDEVRAAAVRAIEARGFEAMVLDAETLEVTGPGMDSGELYLGNIYRDLNRTPPSGRRAALERFVATLLDDTAIPADAAGHARLRPSIYSDEYVDHIRMKAGGEALLAWEMTADLNLVLVMDFPDKAQPLLAGDFADLNLTPGQARVLALDNLRDHARGISVQMEDGIGWLVLDQYYENAAILLPELWDRIDGMVEGRPVMITPARGQVFFASEHDPAALDELAFYADAAQASEPGPISPLLFVWTEDRWEVFRR